LHTHLTVDVHTHLKPYRTNKHPTPADKIELPNDAPLACPLALPSPMPQAGSVLKERAGDMSCEGRDKHGNVGRVSSREAAAAGRGDGLWWMVV
jgi:hypothetical protein